MGKQGLKITYDTVFRKIFDPDTEKGLKRLESLLSAIMGRPLKIISVMPREGTQLAESASFVVMDVLVQLDDMSFANIEIQKIGYSFPLASDHIMDHKMRLERRPEAVKRFCP